MDPFVIDPSHTQYIKHYNAGMISIEYFHAGYSKGDAILFLHDIGSNLRVWLPNIPAFLRTHYVIAPSFRGHGNPSTILSFEEFFSLKACVCDIVGLLEHLKRTRVHVVGLGFGGVVGLELARQILSPVLSLTLVNTPIINRSPSVSKVFGRQLQLTLLSSMARLMGEQGNNFLSSVVRQTCQNSQAGQFYESNCPLNDVNVLLWGQKVLEDIDYVGDLEFARYRWLLIHSKGSHPSRELKAATNFLRTHKPHAVKCLTGKMCVNLDSLSVFNDVVSKFINV